MPQINDIRELAQQNARYVSNSPQDWMSYLDVAARLYRYSFTDTLLIHAQRPDATACAEMELWNQKMSRWVNRGAKGIALLDDTGPRTRLRYVFDIADTHLVRGGRTPLLWNLDSHEHEQTILDHLADTYGLSQTDSMNTALMELAQQLTADNLDEVMDGLAYEVADTFLEELDEDNIRVRFRELMTNSIFYTLSRRCGQEPMDVLDDDDFIRIVDFNKLPVLSFLGNAVSEQCEAVLFDIGREMRKIYKKEITQQLEKSVDSLYNTNTDFSTLKRETKENTTKGGQENGVDVLPQGRLSVPESGREGRAADYREVRDAAQDVPEREPQELVSEYADERQTEPASGADRGRSGEPDGNPAGQPEREVSGTEQGERPAGMGGTSEQPDGDGRRNRLEGIGIQLTEPTTEQDLSEAEEEIASAISLPSLPTVEQQIRAIEAPIQARYADEIALDSEVVDEILRTGSNRSKGQLRLIYNFMVEKTPEEYTEFVKNEYGTGGKGFEIDGAKYAVWFDDLGLRIAAGDTAKGGTIVNAFLSWEDVSNRIHELLRQGEYAPQAVLDAARQNALQEHAQTLAYMERDLADGVAEAVFQDTEIFRGGFPELTDRLAGLLDDTDFLTDLNERLSALGEAYAEDKDLMRMHFYKPDKVAALFQQFAKPYQNYSARDGFHWTEYKKFITEDEINAFFTRGSNYSDSRLAIYSFFLNHEDKKERANFLKDHYGIGGSSHALCGADDSHEDHDGRGISLERGSYGNPDASVHLNWNQAAGRIDQLIRDSEYLKPADYSRMPAYERERMAMRVMGFYHHLPNDVERPYPQDLYHEEGRKALVEKLEAPEQAVELLEQMDNALLSVPLDSGEYERKAESLSILHQYVEGTYTIFPEKKRAVEIAVPEQGQMSMFDFMEQEPQSKEQSTAAAVEEPQKAKVVARYQSTVMMQEGYIENANSESSDSDSIVVPFKNLLNDSYCRDISIKVRSQLDMKRRKGEFIGGYAIYGYCKDKRNKNRLVVDEYAADIVRSIYRRKLEGMSAQAIAEQLNSENVLAPSEYKRLCGLNYHSGFKAGTHAKWQAIQVLRILKNEIYTGTMVQGRRQKINYKIKKIRDVEESGWIRVPNMHEAIIPQKLFDTVQEVLKLDTCASKGQQTVNLFSGIVRCGGCGQNMVRRTVSKNGKKYIYLHCVTNHNGLGCSSHLISESKLAEVVLAALQGKVQQISGLEHRLDEINEIPKNERRLKSVEEHLKMLEQEEQKYQTLRRQLYEDMSSGIVNKEEYKEFSHSFNEKVETIRKAKAEMNRQRDCLNNLDVEHLPWIEDFKSYQNLTSLNRRVLVELVESITVYDKEHIHIQYRFDQEIRNVLEYCSSVPAAETEESAV